MEIKEVRREAKRLQLTVKTKSYSRGVSSTVYDVKSDWSTAGSVFNGKDPSALDFLDRLSKLKAFIGGSDVVYNGEVISGLK